MTVWHRKDYVPEQPVRHKKPGIARRLFGKPIAWLKKWLKRFAFATVGSATLALGIITYNDGPSAAWAAAQDSVQIVRLNLAKLNVIEPTKPVIVAQPKPMEKPKPVNICLHTLHKYVEKCTALEIVARSIMEHESGLNPMAIHFDKCEWKNAEGKCRLNEKRNFDSVEHLARLVEAYQFAGLLKDNFGTGCMQVNVDYHAKKLCDGGDCISNLTDAFDPERNIKAGLAHLKKCFEQNTSFQGRIACYNTSNPANQPKYLARVMPIYERNQADCIKQQFAEVAE